MCIRDSPFGVLVTELFQLTVFTDPKIRNKMNHDLSVQNQFAHHHCIVYFVKSVTMCYTENINGVKLYKPKTRTRTTKIHAEKHRSNSVEHIIFVKFVWDS